MRKPLVIFIFMELLILTANCAKAQEAKPAETPTTQAPIRPPATIPQLGTQPAAPKEQIDRIDLLELRDLSGQLENIRLQYSILDRKAKDLDELLKGKMSGIAQKYKIGLKDQLNMETGQIIRNGAEDAKK